MITKSTSLDIEQIEKTKGWIFYPTATFACL